MGAVILGDSYNDRVSSSSSVLVPGESLSLTTTSLTSFPSVTVGGSTTTTVEGVTDHGALTGLSDDDHSQYALLAGRSGDVLSIDEITEYTGSAGVTIDNILFKDYVIQPEDGSTTNIGVILQGKGTGNLILGRSTATSKLRGSSAYLETDNVYLGHLANALVAGVNGTITSVDGADITLRGGAGYGVGDNDGGDIKIYGGAPANAGSRGSIYFGDGSANGYLPPKGAETNVVYYNTTTGLLSYGAEGAGGGVGNIFELDDVTITSVADGEILVYDSGTTNWINQTLAEAGVSATGHTHVIANITDFTDNSSDWDTAYGWGDHSSAGYVEGTGADDQVAVFNASDTVEGSSNLTYASASGLLTSANINITGSLNVDDIAEYTASAGVTIETVVLEDGGITLGTGATVNTIETTVTDDDTHIPTSGAVVDYLAATPIDHSALTGILGTGSYHLSSAEATNVGNLDSMAYEATTSYYTSAEVDTLLGGYADISGTPVLNQIAFWQDADTIGGDSDLTWDLTTLQVTGTVAATTVTGANVTSGSNPGHTHTTAAVTNLSSYTGFDARYYTETELNTSAAGGQVHWDNITSVPPAVSGAMASFIIDTDNEASTTITDGETITFSEGSNMSVARSGNTITFASTQRGIDSVPVSAEETESISSGWAYNHADSSSAHHTRYSDAEAVSAVASADDYLKNDANDTTSGTITAAGFTVSGGYDVYSEADVVWIDDDNDSTLAWNFNNSHNYAWSPTSQATGSLTITNMADGDSGVLIINSDTSGTLTLPANSDPTTISYTSSAVIVATVLKWVDGGTTRYLWTTRSTAVSPS